jgi:hypothetical protein
MDKKIPDRLYFLRQNWETAYEVWRKESILSNLLQKKLLWKGPSGIGGNRCGAVLIWSLERNVFWEWKLNIGAEGQHPPENSVCK